MAIGGILCLWSLTYFTSLLQRVRLMRSGTIHNNPTAQMEPSIRLDHSHRSELEDEGDSMILSSGMHLQMTIPFVGDDELKDSGSLLSQLSSPTPELPRFLCRRCLDQGVAAARQAQWHRQAEYH